MKIFIPKDWMIDDDEGLSNKDNYNHSLHAIKERP